MKALMGETAKRVMKDSQGRKELGDFVANRDLREMTITLSDGTKVTISRDKKEGRKVAAA
jgi:hypothetical protein